MGPQPGTIAISGPPNQGDKAIAMRWAGAMTAIPAELAGKRRVTDAFCAMIVNTFMGEEIGRKCWPIIMGQTATSIQPVRHAAEQHALALPKEHHRNEHGLAPVNGSLTSGGIMEAGGPLWGRPLTARLSPMLP